MSRMVLVRHQQQAHVSKIDSSGYIFQQNNCCSGQHGWLTGALQLHQVLLLLCTPPRHSLTHCSTHTRRTTRCATCTSTTHNVCGSGLTLRSGCATSGSIHMTGLIRCRNLMVPAAPPVGKRVKLLLFPRCVCCLLLSLFFSARWHLGWARFGSSIYPIVFDCRYRRQTIARLVRHAHPVESIVRAHAAFTCARALHASPALLGCQ
jgi:hypothetical protein